MWICGSMTMSSNNIHSDRIGITAVIVRIQDTLNKEMGSRCDYFYRSPEEYFTYMNFVRTVVNLEYGSNNEVSQTQWQSPKLAGICEIAVYGCRIGDPQTDRRYGSRYKRLFLQINPWYRCWTLLS